MPRSKYPGAPGAGPAPPAQAALPTQQQTEALTDTLTHLQQLSHRTMVLSANLQVEAMAVLGTPFL